MGVTQKETISVYEEREREKRKDRKTRRKSRSEEKVLGFSSSSLFPARIREPVTQGRNHRDRPPDAVDDPGSWIQLFGGQGAYTRVIFVLSECIWNAPAVSLILPAFDDTGSLILLRVR